jgi:PEP-CTERM motif
MSFVSRVLPIAAFAAALAAPASAITLTTPLAGGNGQSGIMFDITAGAQALTITGIAPSIASGTFTIEVYTRPGTVVGNLGATGWTLINSFSGVTGSGAGTTTALDIADFAMAAGSTTGLYITGTVPGTTITPYTNGTAVGNTLASDANLTIKSGFGRSYAFSDTFSPRNYNGSITYSIGAGNVPEPASWALLIAGFGLTGAVARRRRTAVSA